jgi:hypothetical protein
MERKRRIGCKDSNRTKNCKGENLKEKKSSIHIVSETADIRSLRVGSQSPFNHVALLLTTTVDAILTKEKSYEVVFNTGMLEGAGISVDRRGSHITFSNSGTYLFQLFGEIIEDKPDGAVDIIFESNFGEDVSPLATTTLNRGADVYTNIGNGSTLLPLREGQIVSLKIVPSNSLPLALLKGCKLIIFRVV